MSDDDEIELRIEAWHVSDDERELHEYLGWTWDEYRAWLELPSRTPGGSA